MRVAAIYDIHGNLPALETVLDDIQRANVEQIVVGGDVFPGPLPCETLGCLRRLTIPVQFIHGNGDREVLARMAGTETDWYRTAPEKWRETVRWTAEQLRDEDRQLIAGWPATCRLTIGELAEVLFCHATPRNDTEVFTRLTPEERLAPIFNPLNAAVVVCGHTHMQFDRMVGKTRVVNAGSVGMPNGEPGAYWLLLGEGLEFRRTAYDFERAADRIRTTDYPQAAEFALHSILQPPDIEKTLQLLAAVELK